METCCHSDFIERPSANADVKDSQGIIIIIITTILMAPVLENNTRKHQWHFNIQTDHLIPARRPDFIIIDKKKREFAKLSTLLSRRTTE